MKLVSILTDEMNNEVYGYAIKSGSSISYVGVNEQSNTWASWANEQVKSLNEMALPFGVSGSDFQVPSEQIAEILGIETSSITNHSGYAMKVKSVKHDVDSDFINPTDEIISGDAKRKLKSINYKALAFKNDNKLASLITEFKANKHSFDLDTNRFNSKSFGIERNVFHESMRTKMSAGFERRAGNYIVDSRERLVEPAGRSKIGPGFMQQLEQKDIGPKLGSGSARLGRRTLSSMNARFDPNAVDADGDKLVQEGTPFERPDTRIPKPDANLPKQSKDPFDENEEGISQAEKRYRRAVKNPKNWKWKPMGYPATPGRGTWIYSGPTSPNDRFGPLEPPKEVLDEIYGPSKPGSILGNIRVLDNTRGMPSKRNQTAAAVRKATGKTKTPAKQNRPDEPELARYPGQLDANGNRKPTRKFDETTLQDVYKSFTKTTDENPADKYRRVAQEFNMTPHDVEAHINEMHRGSRLKLPFVISPEAAGLTPSEASGNIKKTMSDKEIYERRMDTGISLQDLADELGLSREEIRQAEQRHMAELRRTGTPRSGGVVDDYEMRGMTSRRTGKNVSKKPTGSPRSIARDETLSMLSGGADGDSAMRAVAARLNITDEDTLDKLSKLNYRVAENAYDDNIDIGKMVRDEIPGNMDRSTRNDIVEALDEVAATIRESGGGSKKKPKKLSLTDEEIYDRRMNTGISLQDLAKELGVGRSDIRQAEQRHMAKLRKQTEVSGEVRGMPSRRRSGSTLLGRARRRNASISRVQTVPNAKPEKKKRAVAGAGFKKVGPNDGKFIESLSTEERQKAEDALKQLEKDIALELKGGKVKPTKKNPNPDPDSFGRQNFASYWRGQMAGAEKQRLKGGRFEPRPAQDQLTTSDITEMRLLLERDIASGKIPSVAVDAKTGQPKLNPDGTPAISPAEKIQRLLDDMQVLIGMRDKNQFEMVEHLHPESQKIVAQAATGKDKLRTSEMKKLGLGEESSFFGRAKGLEKGLAEISEENIKLSDTRQRFLRVNPERKRKRELRMARKAGKKNRRGRQLTEKDPLLALEQKKLRSLAARRELASKLRRKRDASKIEEKIQSNKSDGEKMIIRNPDGSVAVNKRFTSALAFVGREYKKDESKGAAERRKQAISNLWENTGFNNEPVLITKDEVQALLDAGWTPIVRGTGNERVKGEAYVEQFLTNPDRFVPGQGGEAHGFGEYFTDDPSSWGGYRGGSGDRHTILALIPPSAQVVDKRTLKQEQANMHKMADEMGRKVQELGGMDAAKKMTPEELAAELRNVLKGHEDKKDSVSHAILDNIISQLESVEREGGDSVRVKDDAIDALEFLRKASGTDEEGRFAPIVGVSLERSTGNVMLLHDRSAIAAVHVPLEDKEAQQLAKGIPSAKKLSKADKKARGIVDVSSWRQTGGQMGSNTAGVYEDPKGAKHYVKTPNSALQAENEVLASELYRMAGVQTPDVTLGTNSDGNLVVVSKMRDDIRNATQQADVDAVQDQFVTHAWLGNWDALLNNNTMIDGQGKPVLIDAGGSLLFRANAGRKGSGGSTPFGDVVGEMDSLRNPSINPQAARVFGKLTPDQIKAQVAKLRQITPDQIRKTVDRMISDMGERKKLADTLIARQQDIITRFG